MGLYMTAAMSCKAPLVKTAAHLLAASKVALEVMQTSAGAYIHQTFLPECWQI